MGINVPVIPKLGMIGIVPICKPPENSWRSGISDICSGITCSANIVKKRIFLPLKSNQAIAYAAKIAMVIGIIVEGMTIAKVFRKY
jgi:hypothetical protein